MYLKLTVFLLAVLIYSVQYFEYAEATRKNTIVPLDAFEALSFARAKQNYYLSEQYIDEFQFTQYPNLWPHISNLTINLASMSQHALQAEFPNITTPCFSQVTAFITAFKSKLIWATEG